MENRNSATTMIPNASAIILAGGQSRRMGRPKATLGFGDSTVLERIAVELGRGFDDLLVVAAPIEAEAFPIEHLLRAKTSKIRLLRDRAAYEGAAVALAQGLGAAKNDAAFVCSCDLPLLRIEVASALWQMLDGYDAVIPAIDGNPQPLCAVYRRGIRAMLQTQLATGERRLVRIAEKLNAYRPAEMQLRKFDPELRSFLNINTPEDYARALAAHHWRQRDE